MTSQPNASVLAATSRDKLWHAIGAYGLSEFAQRATRIATTVLIARTLTPLELGVAAGAITVFEIVRVAASSGIGPAVVRASDDRLEATCHAAHRLGWAMCVGLAVFQMAIAAAVTQWTGRAEVGAMIVALACVYLMMPQGLVHYYLLQRDGRHGAIATVATVQAVVDNVLTIVLALLGFGAWAIVLPKVLTAPIWFIGMRRARQWKPVPHAEPVPAASILRFAVPVVAADLTTMSRSQLDRVLVGAFIGVEALGIYYFVSSAGAGLSHALITALSNSIYPHFAAAGGAPGELLRRLDDSLKRKALPIAGAILLQACLAPLYVPWLFGARWADVAWMVAVPCAAQACKVFSEVGAQALRAAGFANLEFAGTLVITGGSLAALAAGLQFGLSTGVVTLAVAVAVLQLAFAGLARHRIVNCARSTVPGTRSAPPLRLQCDRTTGFPTMPRLYGLMIARDEADIVAESLTYALGHCDKIVCMDNGSTDGTWEIMQDMAERHPGRIIAHCRLTERFHDGLRAIAYNAFHAELSSRDWWLRLDADEFLNEHPSALLAQADSAGADFIRAYQMTFALTDLDVAAIERGDDDRRRPIAERRRHYRVDWREYRLFRNEPAQVWDITLNPQFPQNLSKGRVASRFIFNRHYQNRDIRQVTARIALRATNPAFAHVASKAWRDYVAEARHCHLYEAGTPVRFSPLADFWLPRLKLELGQRLGRLARPA